MLKTKTLTLLIGFLLIVIIGEFIYLFIIKNDKSGNSSKKTDETNTEVSQSKTSPNTSSSLKEESDPRVDENQALPEPELVNLRILEKGVVTSSFINYTMEGTIESIEYRNHDNKKGINFTLKADNGNTNKFLYPQLPILKVVDSQNQEVDIFTIEQNDKVIIKVEYDIINGVYKNVLINII